MTPSRRRTLSPRRAAARLAALPDCGPAVSTPERCFHLGQLVLGVDDLQRQIDEADRRFLELKNQGKPAEATQWLEKGVFLRRRVHGEGSEELELAAQTLVTECNTISMTAIAADDLVTAYEMIKKADILTDAGGLVRDDQARLRLRAVTFNNYGCFYKRRGKLHSALAALDKALRIELTQRQVDNPAATHLNMCAVLSLLGRHRPALQHAQCAINLLRGAVDPRSALGLVGMKEGRDPALLAVALHNAGAEHMHLNEARSPATRAACRVHRAACITHDAACIVPRAARII